jgi:hypothetical protein
MTKNDQKRPKKGQKRAKNVKKPDFLNEFSSDVRVLQGLIGSLRIAKTPKKAIFGPFCSIYIPTHLSGQK